MEFRRVLLGLGIVPVIAGSAIFGACGGDDDGGGGSGDPEEFVADMCGLLKDFTEDLDSLDLGDISSEEDAFEALAEPFETLAADFEDLNAPSELNDWHEEASDALNTLAEQLRDGEFDESALGDDPLPKLPDNIREKYNDLAEDNEDCQDADINFDE